MKRSFLLATILALTARTFAQVSDAPPMDVNQLLQSLKQLRDQGETSIKNRRNTAYQQVMAAAASPEKAAAFWKEAVKAVQFDGASHEGAQLHDWKEGDGEALNDKLGQEAVRMHLQWLALTLQHAAGAETKTMLPQVIEFTKIIQADQVATERLTEQLEKAKEREGPKTASAKKNIAEDSIVKHVHDQILKTPVSGSPVSRWLQLGELVGDGGKKRTKEGGATGWESTPGNLDGIYNAIILPEFRAAKDPRLLEYWDLTIKRETERAAARKLDVEQRDWAQVRQPALRWARAQDVLILGYRNRAIGEMFTLVKSFPQHPEAANWISQIEMLLAPPAPVPAAPAAIATPVAAPASIPSSALLPPPAPVRPAAR